MDSRVLGGGWLRGGRALSLGRTQAWEGPLGKPTRLLVRRSVDVPCPADEKMMP